jgi:hypothetical protein
VEIHQNESFASLIWQHKSWGRRRNTQVCQVHAGYCIQLVGDLPFWADKKTSFLTLTPFLENRHLTLGTLLETGQLL